MCPTRGVSDLMGLPAGTILGPYEILSAIGAGGMGEVYEARDNKLGRNVAIKVLPEAFAHDHDRLSRFQREARMLAARTKRAQIPRREAAHKAAHLQGT
jgi:serine/threonine protein kinase